MPGRRLDRLLECWSLHPNLVPGKHLVDQSLCQRSAGLNMLAAPCRLRADSRWVSCMIMTSSRTAGHHVQRQSRAPGGWCSTCVATRCISRPSKSSAELTSILGIHLKQTLSAQTTFSSPLMWLGAIQNQCCEPCHSSCCPPAAPLWPHHSCKAASGWRQASVRAARSTSIAA